MPTPPILLNKHYTETSVFTAENLLREARRQKAVERAKIPRICVLDPDGDIVRWLVRTGRAERDPQWACYHTDLHTFTHEDMQLGIIGCAVGASFAVLVAEELFASGCELLISVTSAGQIVPIADPPYFVLIERALRDEGTSYHYLPPAEFSHLAPGFLSMLENVLVRTPVPIYRGATWTTDAPFRETASAIAYCRELGLMGAEMEAAALYAFAEARQSPLVCLAHVTNRMARDEGDFEKGIAGGSQDALGVVTLIAQAWMSDQSRVAPASTDTAARPDPTRSTVSRQDTERLAEIYSSHARGYADSWGPVIRPMGQRLLQALPWDGARHVVDLGTGAGTHLPEIRRLARGACVVGVDRSPGMLELARQHGVPLVLMDGVELGFRDSSIDVAVMAFVLFHLDDPVVALKEVCRVLRPGGVVGTVTWAEDPEIEASRVWEAELDSHGARDSAAPRPRRDEALNTPEKMIGLFSATDFEPMKVWVERFEHHWELDELSRMHVTFGRSKRKLESLDASTRAAFLARVRDRLFGLPPEAFIYRAAVVCGVACRPA